MVVGVGFRQPTLRPIVVVLGSFLGAFVEDCVGGCRWVVAIHERVVVGV